MEALPGWTHGSLKKQLDTQGLNGVFFPSTAASVLNNSMIRWVGGGSEKLIALGLTVHCWWVEGWKGENVERVKGLLFPSRSVTPRTNLRNGFFLLHDPLQPIRRNSKHYLKVLFSLENVFYKENKCRKEAFKLLCLIEKVWLAFQREACQNKALKQKENYKGELLKKKK